MSSPFFLLVSLLIVVLRGVNSLQDGVLGESRTWRLYSFLPFVVDEAKFAAHCCALLPDSAQFTCVHMYMYAYIYTYIYIYIHICIYIYLYMHSGTQARNSDTVDGKN